MARLGANVYYNPGENIGTTTYPINLNGAPWRIVDVDFHTYSWEPNAVDRQIGSVIKQFDRPAAEITMTIQYVGSASAQRENYDILHDFFQRSIGWKKPGRLVWGMPQWDYDPYGDGGEAWYIECYAIESETAAAYSAMATNQITFYCPYPQWIRRKIHSFSGTGTLSESSFLDFAYEFDYDFRNSVYGAGSLYNNSPFPADFIMVMGSAPDQGYRFKTVENPRVWINDHEYGITGTLSPIYEDRAYRERITINSLQKTVTHWSDLDDKTVDWFDRRGKRQSVFAKIPSGYSTVAWSGDFVTTIYLYEERSEPPWTQILDN